jgi:hypothetical protein
VRRHMLLLLLAGSHAHTQMRYLTGQPGPIRAATSPTGDGRRSVAGACGQGNLAFGANGVGQLQDGATVTLRQTYAAGHQNAAQKFRMAFSCAGTSASDLADAANALTAADNACTAIKAGVPAPYEDTGTIGVDASNGPGGNDYDVTCTLPLQNLAAGQTAQCTISLLSEGGHPAWGDCVDVDVLSAAGSLPPAPPPAPLLNNAGSYRLAEEGVTDTSASTFTCCPLLGTMAIPNYNDGTPAIVATLSASASGCRENVDTGAPTTAQYLPSPSQVQLQYTGVGSKYETSVTTPIMIGGQPFHFQVDEAVVSFRNDSPEQPIVCDGYSPMAGFNYGGSFTGNGALGSTGPTLLAVLAILIILGAGGFFLCDKTKTASKLLAQQGGVPPTPPPATPHLRGQGVSVSHHI